MGMIERKKAILLNAPHLATASGNIVSFNTDMGIKLKECKVHFFPVQEGSGDPSPSNIRPITGHTGVTITHCGKNIIDFEAVLQSWNSGYTKTGDNSYNVRSTGSGFRSPYIFSEDDINISASGSVTDLQGSVRWRFEFLNSGGTIVGRLGAFIENSSGMYYVPNVLANRYRLNYVTPGNGATYEKIQVELGTECTSYEPYKGIDIPVSWQSEAGTLYGGYVDLVTGELVREYGVLVFDGSNDEDWRVEQINGFKNFYIPYASLPLVPMKDQYSSNTKSACNQAVLKDTYEQLFTSGQWLISRSGALNMALGTASGATTVAEFRTWLSSHNLQVVYKLATPIHYTLSPQAIKTLLGRNNIWSDSGDVTVKYWTH